MKHLLITGISGYIGSTLARALSDDPSVESIVGIDVRPPPAKVEKLHFYKHDLRSCGACVPHPEVAPRDELAGLGGIYFAPSCQ